MAISTVSAEDNVTQDVSSNELQEDLLEDNTQDIDESQLTNADDEIIFEDSNNKMDTIIEIEYSFSRVAIDYDAGERGAMFYGVLKGLDGSPLVNKTVQVDMDNISYNVTTDDYGRCGLQINNNVAKNYNLTLSFKGDENYNPAPSTVTTLIVTKKNSSIDAKDLVFEPYDDINFDVTLSTIKNQFDDKIYINGGKKLTLKINGKSYDAFTNQDSIANFNLTGIKSGKYIATIEFAGDETYNSFSKKIKITIKSYPVVLTVKKAFSTTKSYAKLRAFVEDKDGMGVNEGVVTFKINGKSYSVKVKNGEAIKKIKLSKAKTYTLKTTYSINNYDVKSVSSKVVVSKAKNSYVVKIGKYSCKVSFKDYLKILDAKSWNSVFNKKYDTHKKIKIKYYTYKTKKVTYTKKKLLAHSWISNGKVYSESFESANIAPKGYKYYGAKIVSKGSDVKEYQIYKKTVKKKIKSKPKYKTCKVYIEITTYRWSPNHDVKAIACTVSSYLMNLNKDYNYYSKAIKL